MVTMDRGGLLQREDVNVVGIEPLEIADVAEGLYFGTGARTGYIHLVTGAGAATRKLVDPEFFGQVLDLFFYTDGGGDCAVTADSPINQNADTIMTFSDVGEHIRLVGQWNSTDGWEWRVICNDGVALT